MSVLHQDPDSTPDPHPPLPQWVIELVAAIQQSEDEHPRYLADLTMGGVQPIERCPQSQFLALIPEHVQAAVRRWAP